MKMSARHFRPTRFAEFLSRLLHLTTACSANRTLMRDMRPDAHS